MTAAWIDLWEALKITAAAGDVKLEERYQQGDRERLLPFGVRLEQLLQSGTIPAVGIDKQGSRSEIAPDEWSRVTIYWSDSKIVYGSQRHRFSPDIADSALALGGKVDWLPPIDPGSRHPGLLDDNGRSLRGGSSDEALYTLIRVERTALDKALSKNTGRPPEFRWDEMEAVAMDLLRKHGAPAAGNHKLQTQADLESAILTFYSGKYDHEPSPSSLRRADRLPRWIKNYKSEIAS